MGFLKKIFGARDKPVVVTDFASFWNWFLENADFFYDCVKQQKDVEEKFLDKVIPLLKQIDESFFCLVGMYDDNKAEMVITADGVVKSIVFAEEIVATAPDLRGWKFTALKPALGFEMSITMEGYEFNNENLSFINNNLSEYPDEIDITLVHRDHNEKNHKTIGNGSLIYLDNALGELNTALLIDNVSIAGPPAENAELIPISKLGEFLVWREKEFVEKYKDVLYNTENDEYSALEAKDGDGLPVLAIIDRALLDWDAKPSHPWMMTIEIRYDGKDTNGMPSPAVYETMNQFEDDLLKLLPDSEGYLNLGRETYNGKRTTYFACREFRQSSKRTWATISNYKEKLNIKYDIYKDKYWRTMNRYS
jgi:hypothetical protein